MGASSAHLGSEAGYGLEEPPGAAGAQAVTESNFRPKSPDYQDKKHQMFYDDVSSVQHAQNPGRA